MKVRFQSGFVRFWSLFCFNGLSAELLRESWNLENCSATGLCAKNIKVAVEYLIWFPKISRLTLWRKE